MTDIALPTAEQQQRAHWDLLLLDIEHRTEQLRQMKMGKNQLDIERVRQQMRWEIPKAIAALAAAGAVFFGFVLAAATWLHPIPLPPQQITVHFDQPLPFRQ